MELEWGELVKGKSFITDLKGQAMGECMRYAVWVPDKEQKGKHRIVEVGNDLQKLVEKHCVEKGFIFEVTKGG